MAKDLTGSRVGRFEIRARIGAGGMGEVYRADDTKLKREVALKRLARHLRGDEHYHRSFLREAEQASALNCPSIASIYDVFEEHGEIFIVMEYVEGVNLRHRSAEPTPLSEFLNLAVQCAEALVAAHEKGIVHRDIKPENIMVTASGKVKVLDFGLAKRLNVSTAASTDTQSTAFVGTPGYMAPEVLLEAKPDERADIFSLGIVFYELITGRHPFQTPALIRTADRILHDEAPPLHEMNPTLPAMMESILARMLAKKPQDRYSSARDLLVDLRRLQQQSVSGARLRRVAPRRTWVRPACIAVAVLALLAGSAWLLWSRSGRGNSRASLPSGSRYVAVLPFRAIGTDPEEQAFSDGLTETVTAKLTQLTSQHALQVAPASEVHARKVRDADDARKELGVNLVVDGSVHRLGSIVRVTLSLIDVGSGRQIQADTITAPESEAFNLEDRVVASVAGMFEMQLAPGEQQFLAVADTRSPEAHQAYLEARGYLQNYDKPENLDRAIAGLKQAIAADPNFAAAYATLGEAYWRKFDIFRDPRWVALGRSNCERALGIATNAGPAHTCIGMLENATGQYEGAVADFQQALAADSTSDSAYVGLAMAYEHLNNFPQAEATYRKRISLLPQYWGCYNALGTFYFRNARIDDAVRAFAKVIELVPDSPRGYMNTAAAYLVSGRYDQAIPFLDKSVSLDKGNAAAYSNLGVAYFYLRRYDQAAAAYEKAVALNEKDYIPWGNLAEAYYWAGRRDKATAAYTKAVAYASAQIDLNPRDVAALAALGQYHAMLGDTDDARRFSERAVALAAANTDVLLARAIVFARLGEKDQATATIEKAVSFGLDPSVVRNNPVFDTFINTPALQKALAAGASKGGSK